MVNFLLGMLDVDHNKARQQTLSAPV